MATITREQVIERLRESRSRNLEYGAADDAFRAGCDAGKKWAAETAEWYELNNLDLCYGPNGDLDRNEVTLDVFYQSKEECNSFPSGEALKFWQQVAPDRIDIDDSLSDEFVQGFLVETLRLWLDVKEEVER